jgi:hypothetical protein
MLLDVLSKAGHVESDSNVAGAVVVESEFSTSLMFNAVDGGIVVVRFIGAIKSQFGYPNDEALGGHPLYRCGLRHYGVFEVEESSWLEQTREQNRVCFPDADWFGDGLHHFVFTFHDGTFECLAKEIKVSISLLPTRQVLGELFSRVVGK